MLRLTAEESYRQELEFYTHKLVEGDITPIVFELLKSTEDIDGLLSFLGYKPKPDVTEKQTVVKSTSFSELFAKGVEVG